MNLTFNILLFFVTLLGGLFPIVYRNWTEQKLHLLLTFSGAYLLSVTMLHLIPESASEMGFEMGIYMLIGFFLQQILQKFTHGLEHGHNHSHDHHHHQLPIISVIIGMTVHAFAEGIPLGAVYQDHQTVPALYLAIALHKLPEAMVIASLLLANKNSKWQAFLLLAAFSLLSPLSSFITHNYAIEWNGFAKMLPYIIAVVTGSFLHIGTTIFYESGNKLHSISFKKWLATFTAIALAFLTMVGASHDHHYDQQEASEIHNHSH
ncbi:MAG TPA: ZIP family metal transporter [Edaphocola sp.]|nr:ZIP family metal transporter [Edaphocola sp.]